jgi:hypothetical protein
VAADHNGIAASLTGRMRYAPASGPPPHRPPSSLSPMLAELWLAPHGYGPVIITMKLRGLRVILRHLPFQAPASSLVLGRSAASSSAARLRLTIAKLTIYPPRIVRRRDGEYSEVGDLCVQPLSLARAQSACASPVTDGLALGDFACYCRSCSSVPFARLSCRDVRASPSPNQPPWLTGNRRPTYR